MRSYVRLDLVRSTEYMPTKILSGEDWRRFWGSWLFRKRFSDELFDDLLLDNVPFNYANFAKCVFRSCKFRNCHIGSRSQFVECVWENCSFSGKYSGFSSGAKFIGCEFHNVDIKSTLMSDVRFSGCKISGRLNNLIFVGKHDEQKRSVILENCDLSEVEFDNVSFVAGIDLSTVKLPKRGIRLFSNEAGSFTEALVRAARELDNANSVPFEVLCQTTRAQELVVVDIPTFKYLFEDAGNGRAAFELLAQTFEITERVGRPDASG